MKRVFILLIVGLMACSKEVEMPLRVAVSSIDDSPFVGTMGSLVSMSYPKDVNGYYIVPIDTTTSYARYNVYVEATKLKPQYRYNGRSVIQANFDCNSYWLILDSLAVTIPLYSPFASLSSSPYFNTRLSVKNTTIVLSQFKNTIVPIVPSTGIYLKDYFSGSTTQPSDEYKPTNILTRDWSKRIIGPIPSYFRGDTIKVYCKISWDAGQYSISHPELTTKLDSVRIIFK